MLKVLSKHRWIAIGLLACFVVACTTVTRITHPKPDRGLRFSHEIHKKEMDCDTCHDMHTPGASMPTHDLCSVCHEIDVDNPTPDQCGHCHKQDDYTVLPLRKRLPDEIKFEHAQHLAKEIACDTCHPGPDTSRLPSQPLKTFCMDCHGQTDPKLNECSVCHEEMSENAIPTRRAGLKIAHDAPEIWLRQHGRESQIDPGFCALCHDQASSCEECHRSTKPQNHTVAWRRTGHGFQATLDRNKCAVCHEEDSCIKCHRSTKPASHRRAWGEPFNRHCVNCHYPPERTGCTVCHDNIEHKKAMPSPHTFGFYPPNCALCHPGGIPYLAPHPTNSTVSCRTCH